jgi:hypothetical protein
MQTAEYTATNYHPAPAPAMRIWVGRSISALAALFLLLDGVIKVLQLASAVDASAQLGYGAGLTLSIGMLELACLAVYLLPRTAPLGALLLTGYLGGAVATHLRAGSPLFSVVFPLLLGALLWGGLALRERRVRALLSLTS